MSVPSATSTWSPIVDGAETRTDNPRLDDEIHPYSPQYATVPHNGRTVHATSEDPGSLRTSRTARRGLRRRLRPPTTLPRETFPSPRSRSRFRSRSRYPTHRYEGSRERTSLEPRPGRLSAPSLARRGPRRCRRSWI